MRKRRIALVVMAGLMVAVAIPATANAKYHEFDCKWRHGPEFRFTLGPRTLKSTTYELRGFGATCSFAKKWTATLAKQPYRGGTRPHRLASRNKIAGGPPGWDCWSSFIQPDFHPKTAFTGVCQNRRNRYRTFDWSDGGDHMVVPA